MLNYTQNGHKMESRSTTGVLFSVHPIWKKEEHSWQVI